VYIGDSNVLPTGATTSVPPSLPLSPGETVWVDVSRAILKEGPSSGVPHRRRWQRHLSRWRRRVRPEDALRAVVRMRQRVGLRTHLVGLP
jgi:hypothetical protein